MDKHTLPPSVSPPLRGGSSIPIPKITTPLLNAFAAYCRWYVPRSFHAVRLSVSGGVPAISDTPLIVYLNHASWWDPLICLLLAKKYWPVRQHFAPIDAAGLERYPILSRMGFFGVKARTRHGAAMFLRNSSAILQASNSAIWITSQGQFNDPRTRPFALRPGLAHLARKHPEIAIVPLAIEYPFWQERFPEVLCRFGEPIPSNDQKDVAAWNERLAGQMQMNQDALALESIAREPAAFQTILRGKAGVGGFYDAWRWTLATLKGQRFRREHGEPSP
jgi:1-acyl-sn-glycerol-3-phosphate acyltransferase